MIRYYAHTHTIFLQIQSTSISAIFVQFKHVKWYLVSVACSTLAFRVLFLLRLSHWSHIGSISRSRDMSFYDKARVKIFRGAWIVPGKCEDKISFYCLLQQCHTKCIIAKGQAIFETLAVWYIKRCFLSEAKVHYEKEQWETVWCFEYSPSP